MCFFLELFICFCIFDFPLDIQKTKMEIETTIDNLAPSKLLNYVQKDQLIEFVTPTRYAELEQRLRTSLNKPRVNLKDVKKHLASRADFVTSLREHPIGAEAFHKYTEAVNRLRSIDRTQASAVRKVMTQPRRRFQGCLATRLKPSDYDHCLDNYTDEQFDNVKLVPPGLKQRVYDRGDVATKGILEQTLTRKGNPMSDIPAGYRYYMSHNPDKFKEYFEQRRHEVGLMKAVMRNLSNDDKRRLQAYYDEHKRIQPEKFSDIIKSFRPGSPAKRPRVAFEEPKTGGRFDLEQRIRDSEAFGDQSVDDVLDFD
jgi:hypothetical protein